MTSKQCKNFKHIRAQTSQRSQLAPTTPGLQWHWPVWGSQRSVPHGEQLHPGKNKIKVMRNLKEVRKKILMERYINECNIYWCSSWQRWRLRSNPGRRFHSAARRCCACSSDTLLSKDGSRWTACFGLSSRCSCTVDTCCRSPQGFHSSPERTCIRHEHRTLLIIFALASL